MNGCFSLVVTLARAQGTHQQAVAQSVEMLLICLQLIPVQLPAACGSEDEGESVGQGLTDPTGF